MIDTLLVDFLIFLSVAVCAFSAVLSAVVIYRRDSRSNEHRFFALFFLGLAGLVVFYLFFQDPILKEVAYPLQMLGGSISVLGLFNFYYALDNEGKASQRVFLYSSLALFSIPLLCVLFHPYSFVEEVYGFELFIDTWFSIYVIGIFSIFTLYTLTQLIRLYFRSSNDFIRRKLFRIYVGLGIIFIAGLVFLGLVPIFLDLHYLKPCGYAGFTIGICIMASAFKREGS